MRKIDFVHNIKESIDVISPYVDYVSVGGIYPYIHLDSDPDLDREIRIGKALKKALKIIPLLPEGKRYSVYSTDRGIPHIAIHDVDSWTAAKFFYALRLSTGVTAHGPDDHGEKFWVLSGLFPDGTEVAFFIDD